jgi:predicted transcriptional regulator/PKD repeat protein
MDDLPPQAVISSPAGDQLLANDGPTTLIFDGSESSDPDGALVSWSWDFGDGAHGSGPVADHTYEAGGTYTVVLTVTDNGGLSDSAVRRITLSPWAALSADITSPADGAVLSVNETAGFSWSTGPGTPADSLGCRWDLGDGTVTTEPAPRHSYSRPGFFIVRLTVENLWGGRSNSSISLIVRPESSSRTELSWKGDTVIDGDRTLDGCSITLSGSLTVSGNLTLVASELSVLGLANGSSGIRVAKGGRLVLGTGTTVRASDPAARFWFRVQAGAGLVMMDSELSGCGWFGAGGGAPSQQGLYIETNEAVITRCRIALNGAGIVVDHGASPAISGSDISLNDGWGIRVLNGSAPLIRGNLLRGNALLAPAEAGPRAAISSVTSSPVIFNNTILGDPAAAAGRLVYGIGLSGSGKPKVAQNTIRDHRGEVPSAAIASTASEPFIHDNLLVSNTVGLDIGAGRARVERNTVDGGSIGPHVRSTVGLLDSSASAFRGNRFTGYDFGAQLREGSRPAFESDSFSENLYGVDCQSSALPFRVALSNCTFSGNFRDILVSRPPGGSSAGRLALVNCTYDPALVQLDDPDPTVAVGWYVDFLVLDGDTLRPAAGATVSLTGYGGTDAGSFVTGPDGRTGPLGLESFALAPGFSQSLAPYIVVAVKDGLSSVEWPLDLSGPSEPVLLLRRTSTSLVVLASDAGLNSTARVEAGRPLDLAAVGVPEPSLPDVAYTWDFGDGKAGNGPEGRHVYDEPGRYNVVLTARRGDLVMVGTLTVEVRAAPVRPSAGQIAGPYIALALGISLVVGAVWLAGFTDIGLFALGWSLMLLYSKIARAKVLDNFLRGKIYGYILANPGDHYNSIMDALKLSNGTFAYHIRLLEREELVKSQPDGVYKRFYPAEMVVPTPDRTELTRIQRIICDIITEKPGINQSEVAALLNLSSATVNYHMDTLMRKNHVRRERVGMKVRYYPVPTGRAAEDDRLASMLTPPL